MKLLRKKLPIVIVSAVATMACLPIAYASWDNGGWGVVQFDPQYNPDKIIFLDQVYMWESAYGYGTNRDQYDWAWLTARISKIRNPIPWPSIPSREYDPQRGGVDYQRLTSDGPVVYSHISKGAPAPCGAGEVGCAWPGAINSSSVCAYTKVTTTLEGEISGGAETTASVNNVETTTGVSASGSISRAWEKGWQSCQVEGYFHSCPSQVRSIPVYTYATTEARSRWGWQKFKTSSHKFYFHHQHRDQDSDFCHRFPNSEYVAGNWFFGRTWGYCATKKRANDADYYGNVPTYERYERMPIPNSAATPQIVPGCRVIKQLNP